MKQPESAAASAMKSLPEIFLKMTKTGFDAAMQIQTIWWKKQEASPANARKLIVLKTSIRNLHSWGEIYEKRHPTTLNAAGVDPFLSRTFQ